MATDRWTDSSDNWGTPSDWSAGVPGPSSDVVTSSGGPEVTKSFGTVNSIDNSTTLFFTDAGASLVTGGVTNSSDFQIDPYTGEGGSSLTIGGALANSGQIAIGPSDNTLSAPDTVDAAPVANLIGTQTGPHVERMVNAIECAVMVPSAEVIIHGAARRQVLR